MSKQVTLRTLALSLVLVSSASQAGLFSKKKPAPPPPPEPAPVVVPVAPPPPPPPIPLEFSGIQTEAPLPAPMDRLQAASPEVLDTVQWVAASKDNAGLPFVVVDKVNARVYAFNPLGQLQATAPVLLGMGVGDKALVSQDAPMSAMPPEKRITPAGRYPSRLVTDNHGKTVLLIDGENLITMHIVVKGTPAQRRAERLASVSTADNRISFGCINVPPGFFTTVVDPDFRPKKGVVYILPEKTTAGQLFGFQPRAASPVAPAGSPMAIAASIMATPAPASVAPTASTVATTAPTMTPTALNVAPAAATFTPTASTVAPATSTPAPGAPVVAADPLMMPLAPLPAPPVPAPAQAQAAEEGSSAVAQ